jgi:hypothetical protein
MHIMFSPLTRPTAPRISTSPTCFAIQEYEPSHPLESNTRFSTRAIRSVRIIFKNCCVRVMIVPVFLSMFAGQIFAAESLDESINYLLNYVAKSDATFIRNGQIHTPQEAVDHIKAKYEHFKNEIKPPEDFIRLSASKSLLTGQPYLVRTRDGKEMQLDTWLTAALKNHRSQ